MGQTGRRRRTELHPKLCGQQLCLAVCEIGCPPISRPQRTAGSKGRTAASWPIGKGQVRAVPIRALPLIRGIRCDRSIGGDEPTNCQNSTLQLRSAIGHFQYNARF